MEVNNSSSSSYQHEFFDRSNSEYERSFALATMASKEMSFTDECNYAARKIYSYNPNSKVLKEIFPDMARVIEEIGKIIEFHGVLLKGNVKLVDSWNIIGNCYLALGDFPNAFASYCHSLRINPNITDPYIRYALGVVFLHYNYIENGIKYLNPVINADSYIPFIEDAIFRSAIAYRNNMNFASSNQLFEKLLNSPPIGLTSDDIFLQIAYTMECSNQKQLAHGLYTKIYENNRTNTKYIQHYLFFLFSTSILKPNDPILNDLYKDNPQDPVANLLMGRFAAREQSLEKAFSHYKQSAVYWIDSYFFWAELSSLYFSAYQLNDCLSALGRVISLNPKLEIAWFNMAHVMFIMKSYDEVIKLLQKAQTLLASPDFTNNASRLISSNGSTSKWFHIDDTVDLEKIPEQFSKLYCASPPILPSDCYGSEGRSIKFDLLANYPKSIFSK